MVKLAVVDRIVEERLAVLLVGEEEVEHVLPLNQLPADAKEGTWVNVTFHGEQIIDIQIDTQKTKESTRRIQQKMKDLRQRSRSKFTKE